MKNGLGMARREIPVKRLLQCSKKDNCILGVKWWQGRFREVDDLLLYQVSVSCMNKWKISEWWLDKYGCMLSPSGHSIYKEPLLLE
jgi:hypothetical protein